MKLLVLIITLLFITSCQKKENVFTKADSAYTEVEIHDPKEVDTTLLKDFRAIIKHKDFPELTLTKAEVKQADALLMESVVEYNERAQRKYEDIAWKKQDYMIDLRYYVRQYEPQRNKNGEKIVVIFGMCIVSGNNWRQAREYVSDGGLCFFSVEINLDSNSAAVIYPHGVG